MLITLDLCVSPIFWYVFGSQDFFMYILSMKPFFLAGIMLMTLSGQCQTLYNVAGWLLTGNINMGKQVKPKGAGHGYMTVTMNTKQKGPIIYPNPYSRITVNVDALRYPYPTYGYQQLANRVYGGTFNGAAPPPYFLLQGPPLELPTYPAVRVRRSRSSPEQ
jgi:hypothetical protein